MTYQCSPVVGALGNELQGQYDVVVVGAGTGEVAAAMQAARLGATVLLLEPTDWIGGQMAAADVTSMDEGCPPRGRLRERGIYGEFWRRATSYYEARERLQDINDEGMTAVEMAWFRKQPLKTSREQLARRVSRALLSTMNDVSGPQKPAAASSSLHP